MVFLSKYNKDIKLNDLSKKLAIPLKTITEATKFLEDNKLILKKDYRLYNCRFARSYSS